MTVTDLARDAWRHELRGPNGEWVHSPGEVTGSEAYGHGRVIDVGPKRVTVRFGDGSVRRFGSLYDYPLTGEDAYFKARIGPTQDDTPDPANISGPRKLAPEIPAVDRPWGPGAGFEAMDSHMVNYTTKGNGAIEAALRRGEQPPPPMNVTYADNVIASRHLTQPTILYRGIALTPELEAKLKPGAVFTDRSYTSTSTAPQWADEFADFRVTGTAPWANKEMLATPVAGKPARIVIHAPAGQEIGPGEPGLAEYVLPRDSRFRVTGTSTDASGRVTIDMDVLPHGPHQPLKPVAYPDPRDRFLRNQHIDPVTGVVTYGMGGIAEQFLDLGWRFNPAEPRNEFGEWTRTGEFERAAGAAYRSPDAHRLESARGTYHNPADHPFFKKHPVSPENIMAVYDRTPEAYRQQGMRWYADAHSVAKAIAKGDAEKGATVLSAYSPQTAWPVNMFNADRAFELGRAIGPGEGMITRTMQANAQKGLDGQTVEQALKSPKTRAFGRLIRNGGDMPDDPMGDVVIDRHAMSVALGKRLPKSEADLAPIDKERFYAYVADQYREAARRISQRDGISLAPHQLQAMTWLQQQDENDYGEATANAGAAGRQQGRETMIRNAWRKWNAEARHDEIPTHEGTTMLDAAAVIAEALEMAFNPREPRDNKGRWTRFGGVGRAVDAGAIDLADGWKDAWHHELRDARGRWTVSYEAGRMRTDMLPPARPNMRKGSLDALTESVRQHGVREPIALRHDESGVYIANGQHRAAAARAAGVEDVPVIIQHGGVNPRSVPLRGRRPATVHEFERAYNAHESLSSDVEKQHADLAASLDEAFRREKNPEARKLLDYASAYWNIKGSPNLHKDAAAQVREAAGLFPENTWSNITLKNLAAGMYQVATAEETGKPPSAFREDPADAATVKGVLEKSVKPVEDMFPGTKIHWDGETPTLFDQADRPSLLAEVDWDGHVNISGEVAEAIRTDTEAGPGGIIAHPAAHTVVLHELIHEAVAPDDDHDADKSLYQRDAYQRIEEGFSELGTIQHAAEYFGKIGIAGRKTDMYSGSTSLATLGQYAQSVNTPERIRDGNAWGHYRSQTRDAYNWVALIARDTTGSEDPAVIRRLADEINSQGTAGKVRVMARQALEAAGITPEKAGEDEYRELLDDTAGVIAGNWEDRTPQEVATIAEYRARQSMRQLTGERAG